MSKPPETTLSEKRIVFFDGICLLCDGYVDFLMKRDKKKRLWYSTLQSQCWKDFPNKPDLGLQEGIPESIVYFRQGVWYSKSTAVLFILKDMGWWWTQVFFLFPRFIRDLVYTWIARNSYRWFGKRQTCRMPDPAKDEQILA